MKIKFVIATIIGIFSISGFTKANALELESSNKLNYNILSYKKIEQKIKKTKNYLFFVDHRSGFGAKYTINRRSCCMQDLQVEGLNNKIKVLKRQCYGIYDLKHFFQRLFLDLSGYELYAVKIGV